MTLESKNQKDIINSELLNSYDIEYIFSNKTLNRVKNKPTIIDKNKSLLALKEKIQSIENCELKTNAHKIVFSARAGARGSLAKPASSARSTRGPCRSTSPTSWPLLGRA